VSHNAASPQPRSDLLGSLDDSKISRFQIKIMFVSGTGFFADAYDLIMSEYAGKNTGGRMVSAMFANQAAGLIVGPLIPSIFLASGLSDRGRAQLSPGVWMSTPSTDGYFCRHC
jgi:hypothetical protein